MCAETACVGIGLGRGNGGRVGTALLGAVRAELEGRGCRHWSISVAADNADAVRLYERVGFRPLVQMMYAPLDDRGRPAHDRSVLVQLLAFAAVSAVVICTPGQDTALTVRNALLGGRRAGVHTAGGVALGQLVWTIAASAGIAGLLHASEPAFRIVQLAGAAYLLVLGAQSLWAAYRGTAHGNVAGQVHPLMRPGRALRQGLVSNLANPKMAAFFLSLLPQFVPAGQGSFACFLLLGALFCLMTFGWLAGYSLAVDRARRLFDRTRVRRALDALSGGLLVVFGVRMAVSSG